MPSRLACFAKRLATGFADFRGAFPLQFREAPGHSHLGIDGQCLLIGGDCGINLTGHLAQFPLEAQRPRARPHFSRPASDGETAKNFGPRPGFWLISGRLEHRPDYAQVASRDPAPLPSRAVDHLAVETIGDALAVPEQ